MASQNLPSVLPWMGSLRSCRLCCKYKSVTNTLAYYSKVEITKNIFYIIGSATNEAA
jgi:hypothetical protein